MSIIHNALKKVQERMGNAKKNPEDIVEVLPSSNPNQKPEDSSFKKIAILSICLAIIVMSIYIGIIQLRAQNPDYLKSLDLPKPQALFKTIESAFNAILNKMPFVKSSNDPNKLNEPKKDPKPLAQLKVTLSENNVDKAPKLPPPNDNPTINKPDPKPQEIPTNTDKLDALPPIAPSIEQNKAISVETTINAPSDKSNEALSGSDQSSNEFILNVQGVMSNTKGNVALINNGIYEEGAVINGIKIVKISMKQIVLEHDGIQETLDVNK